MDNQVPEPACGAFVMEDMLPPTPGPGEPGGVDAGGMMGMNPTTEPPASESGCGCRVVQSDESERGWWLVLAVMGLVGLRRRASAIPLDPSPPRRATTLARFRLTERLGSRTRSLRQGAPSSGSCPSCLRRPHRRAPRVQALAVACLPSRTPRKRARVLDYPSTR